MRITEKTFIQYSYTLFEVRYLQEALDNMQRYGLVRDDIVKIVDEEIKLNKKILYNDRRINVIHADYIILLYQQTRTLIALDVLSFEDYKKFKRDKRRRKHIDKFITNSRR